MNNPVTLEQARALDALDRCGTFVAAARELHRGHTSVLYTIRTLEDALGFAVLDRSRYRTTLSPHGKRVLEACRGLLAGDAELAAMISELRAGWEPALTVVYDGIVPVDALLRTIGKLALDHVPTRFEVHAAFLGGVEDAFDRLAADFMIAVLPPRRAAQSAFDLPALPASLVAHASHPLARGRHDARTLRRHLLLTVHGSDPRLELSTSSIEAHSTVLLNDFASKRAAILAGIGYGWLPDTMIERDLAAGKLRRIRWTRTSRHVFHPRLHQRGSMGPAARQLVAALVDPR